MLNKSNFLKLKHDGRRAGSGCNDIDAYAGYCDKFKYVEIGPPGGYGICCVETTDGTYLAYCEGGGDGVGDREGNMAEVDDF